MLLNLPRYWAKCREAQATMDVHQTKVAYGPHWRQYAIVVRNRDETLRRPGRYAFYFHGGAWTFGKPETFTPAAIPWLREGFTVVLPSYRRPPMVGLHRIVEDCWSAVSHFANKAGPEAIVHVGGISAGAHLAAVLATQPKRWLRAGWSAAPERALLCAGPLSLGLLRSGRFLLPRYADVDAIQVVQPPHPEHPLRWQLLHGTIDPVVAPAHSEVFLEKLRALGHQADLEYLEGGRHLDAGRWMFGGVARETVEEFIKVG
ncbi:alpha/beta hydrolase [Lewinella sp. 4G2]|uniref:alpha/beta hydrolase n=1 Tax=Lewinella sp. 4G2 TaxID=1803372 RepID=UPI0007B497D9|nr:alpha/beta hydrolase [Lewinella sp. 4G2]OAV42731.1 hypothetical protein A3850_015945 [Lewinella sp. 4G2]